ncbi:MAG: hypothetical protein CVU78_07515 [Elusimicrobia bacterium HGW-Elusimicrobia-2]|nr:MAG: hypothetical protein CVU78_07515 [Elusimicrobia bacterium HGW-Elusimicrobia-2]
MKIMREEGIRDMGKEKQKNGFEYEVAQMSAFTPMERFRHFNELLKLSAAFRKVKTDWPIGVFKFRTFKEADKWRFQVITGQRPGH